MPGPMPPRARPPHDHGAGVRLAWLSVRLLRAVLAAFVLAVLLAGIPWGLAHYIGQPLPTRIPSGDELLTTLSTPLSTRDTLRVLACVLWPTWAWFVLDVARTARDAATGLPRPHLTSRSPTHALAAALIGMLTLGPLTSRTSPPAAPAPAVLLHLPDTTAENNQRHTAPADFAPLPPHTLLVTAPQNDPPEVTDAPGTVTVRLPSDGVYDSLWRIADRALGDGNRWPEIFRLNEGVSQADGRALTHPGLIRPGWILHLPESAPSPPGERPGEDHGDEQADPPAGPAPSPSPPEPPQETTPAPEPPTPTPSVPQDSTPAPEQQPATPAPDVGEPDGDQGVVTPTGAFVGLGLAALITAAWATLLLRRRIHYRPGHGQREELSMAPVVRTLRLAHDRAHPPAPDGGLVELEPATPRAVPVPEAALRDRARQLAQAQAVEDRPAVGIADGRAIALDLARTRGLGLTGPGAHDAARALLVAMLADHHRPGSRQTRLLIPAPDAALLLGPEIAAVPHALRLRVTGDLDEALEVMERELLTRSRGAVSADPADELGLVATSQPHSDRRLQAILDNGSSLGLSGLLLGPWHPGTTLRVRQDGTIAATSPSAPVAPGVRLFTLPADEADELVGLLREEAAARPAPRRSPVGTAERAEERHRRVSGTAGPAKGSTTHLAKPPSEAAHQPPEGEASQPQEAGEAARLVVLGRLRLALQPLDATDPEISLAPRHRDLFAFLALHRAGTHRDVLCAALWPEARRPHNAFHATASQLRKTLAAEAPALEHLVLHHEGHYRLDAGRLSVDLWQLQAELADFASRPAEQQERALHRIDELYQGELAADLAGDWLDAPREALRRDVLNAHSLLVRSLRSSAPEKALHFLEISRRLDPHNETIYCEIARLQVRLGQPDGVPRTLALLTTALAEIDEEPSAETIRFFDTARRPATRRPGERPR
ncbi:hypothetical protein RM780_09845 [Streptomyces sp. DSM 44917]|uniref:Bacterial transcriptional activator domain-containing protein n=1 Tax=Streptomyces boetiae TaxID=3075541 RepID=A0ABU2L6S8_9ACTN|nr:hypothetical protein [Streptomyces sp. DSM 44917]MDT0307264.1 hypothetical protein [Streptomyces sp. DSM 44917]